VIGDQVMGLLTSLGVPIEQVQFTVVKDHGLTILDIRGPFSGTQLIEIYSVLNKILNPDPSKRMYSLQVTTTVTP